MAIQWFPGHMAKARRQIEEKLSLVDIVYELVDARIPYSSRNPMLNEILKKKPRLIILTKIDLADREKTKQWVEYFHEQGILTVEVNAMTNEGIKNIINTSQIVLKEKIEKDLNRGLKQRPIRALIVGIPNVGKSTLINRIVGKKAAAVGDRPGVTKVQQWIKITNELELLDTPGILWPRFEEIRVGLNLAATGAIKEEILPKDEVAVFILKYLTQHYPKALVNRYGIDGVTDENIVDVYDSIGKKRGCIQSGGVIDYDKVTDLVLRDLKEGYFGRVTFEIPTDLTQDDVKESTTKNED